MTNAATIHKRLTMLETAIRELKEEIGKDMEPVKPRKRRDRKQEAFDKYEERYMFGKKKKATQASAANSNNKKQ